MDDHASPQQTAEEYVAAQKARYIADVRETAPSIADVMQRAVEHMSRDEMQAELSRLRKELAEAVAAHNELVEELRQAHNTYGDMLAEARNKALHDAAVVGYRVCAQTRHVKLGDAVADEIRSLKDTTHDKA